MLASQPPEVRIQILRELGPERIEQLRWDWNFWARPQQLAPVGSWLVWLALAGRGFGKTETGAQWIKRRVKEGAKEIALVAETQKDLDEVMVARILSIYAPGDPEAPEVRYKPTKLTWPNGAVAYGYNGTKPDQLRGPEFDTAWVDELAKYDYAEETWDMLQFTMRGTAIQPRIFVSTTPRNIQVIRDIMEDDTTVVTSGSTYDNAGNLPKSFINAVERKYEGTRLGRQELHAALLTDVPGALWTQEDIDGSRLHASVELELSRIVVSIDPPVTSGEDSDECGIMVAGAAGNIKQNEGHGFLLADRTLHMAQPQEWAEAAIKAYHEFSADLIIAEVNNGGELVESVVRQVDPLVNYKAVRASRGKVTRAEPVSALYEQHRVHHVGIHDKLEDQMCSFTPTGLPEKGKSPDRVDAMVWAMTELLIAPLDLSIVDVVG